MTEEREYMIRAIAALEDARAYIARVEQIEREKKIHRGVVYALQNCRLSVMQTHDACTGLLEELK